VLLATTFCFLTAAAYGQRADKKGNREFVFRGVVESVDSNARWVSVTNENIPGWLEPVKMTYKVDNPEVLKTVQPGDHVTAKVYAGDFRVLYEFRAVPPEDTPVFFPKRKLK